MKKGKKRFSTVKAVKANARERLGQPKPVRVLEEKNTSQAREKHKTSLSELLVASERA